MSKAENIFKTMELLQSNYIAKQLSGESYDINLELTMEGNRMRIIVISTGESFQVKVELDENAEEELIKQLEEYISNLPIEIKLKFAHSVKRRSFYSFWFKFLDFEEFTAFYKKYLI